jgi:hypothetical protein
VTTATVIALATVLLATARWWLSLRHTAQRVYPERSLIEDALLADARRDLERSQDLGAALGYLRAWHGLLSDTAAEAVEAPGREGRDSGADARWRTLDAAEERIRAALAGSGRLREGSAPSRQGSEGREPWNG